MTLAAVTCFAGLGGSSHALSNLLDLDLLGAIERDKTAVASLKANGLPAIQADVREIDWQRHFGGDVDVFVGGPPCQPFSQGGRNAGDADERDCVPDFIRGVAELLPQVFVMENVQGLASPRHRDYLYARIAELEVIGYTVDGRVLDASDYGIPQARKRLFVVGVRLDVASQVRWPAKIGSQTMAEALDWEAAEGFLRNEQAPEAARVRFEDVRWRWPYRRPSTTVVGSFRPDVQAAPGYRKAGDGPRQNAPGSVVTTPHERLILQGLPSDWKVEGSKTKVDLQIGNTCPPRIIASLVAVNLYLSHPCE